MISDRSVEFRFLKFYPGLERAVLVIAVSWCKTCCLAIQTDRFGENDPNFQCKFKFDAAHHNPENEGRVIFLQDVKEKQSRDFEVTLSKLDLFSAKAFHCSFWVCALSWANDLRCLKSDKTVLVGIWRTVVAIP